MKKRQTFLSLNCIFFMLTSCSTYTDPHWPVAEHDLIVAFPENRHFFTYKTDFRLNDLVDSFFGNSDYWTGDPLMLDKIYFGACAFTRSGPPNLRVCQNQYSLFSVEYDGTGLTEIYHDDYEFEFEVNWRTKVLGLFENKLIFRQFGYMHILDLGTGNLVYQSTLIRVADEQGDRVDSECYTYLGEDKFVRIGHFGTYVVKWNPSTHLYEEILYPSTFTNQDVVLDFIDDTVIFGEPIFDNDAFIKFSLKGLHYEDGTWVNEVTCQALMDTKVSETDLELYTIETTEIGKVLITHQITRKEDQLTRNLTKEYLVGLYHDLQMLYNQWDFVLYEIIQQEEDLYLSFSYYRDYFGRGHEYSDRLLFTYDIDFETMTYLGFYDVFADDSLVILDA